MGCTNTKVEIQEIHHEIFTQNAKLEKIRDFPIVTEAPKPKVNNTKVEIKSKLYRQELKLTMEKPGLSFNEVFLLQIEDDIRKCQNLKYLTKEYKSPWEHLIRSGLISLEPKTPAQMYAEISMLIKQVERLEIHEEALQKRFESQLLIEALEQEIANLKYLIIQLDLIFQMCQELDYICPRLKI